MPMMGKMTATEIYADLVKYLLLYVFIPRTMYMPSNAAAMTSSSASGVAGAVTGTAVDNIQLDSDFSLGSILDDLGLSAYINGNLEQAVVAGAFAGKNTHCTSQ
jgi:hypothetical protein